ncbi:o-succinylbenzoate synthase [Actinomycetaceae bacterium TAE3-ERU4]|nr:o-succinylbenzoate synthase [Actinomycetaceae bacterium TAE3-ERU4]
MRFSNIRVPTVLQELGITRGVVWQVPLKVRFRGIETREGLGLLGPAGWGECSPFWDYDSRESSTWLRAALEMAREEPPRPLRETIPLNVTVPVVSPEKAEELVLAQPGALAAKVKVADPRSSLVEDCARLEAVRSALGTAGKIRIDANAAWEKEEAVKVITELSRAAGGLDYVEQPCWEVEDLAWVRSRVQTRVAADESVRRAEDPLKVVRAQAADLLVVKMQPLGGIRAALEIIEKADIPVVISSALDSSVGIWGAVRLAAAVEKLDGPCGLGTGRLFVTEPAGNFPPQNCTLTISSPRPEYGERLQTQDEGTRELVARWERRLEEMCSYL